MLTLPSFAQDLLAFLESHGFEAFVVGGCVRDSLLGFSPHDWDICTSATPEQALEVFKNFRVVETGRVHGTITVLSKQNSACRQIEVTTYRREGTYQDHRHPDEVCFVSNIQEDLARRDFTVNAMAFHPKHGLMDPYHGETDLKKGILRCVGIPTQRFTEDALRILRGLRFSACYGFSLETETAKAMHSCRNTLGFVAMERIWAELSRMLCGPSPGKVLAGYVDVLGVFLPELFVLAKQFPQDWNHSLAVLDASPPELHFRTAALLKHIWKTTGESAYISACSSAEKLLIRLKVSGTVRKGVELLLRESIAPPPCMIPQLRRLIGRAGFQGAQDTVRFHRAQAAGMLPKQRLRHLELCQMADEALNTVRAQQLCCCLEELEVRGTDLISAGMLPGKAIGQALELLLNLVIDGVLPNKKQALLEYVVGNTKTSGISF